MLVLAQRVPEHAQALSIVAVTYGVGVLAGVVPVPASVLALSGGAWTGYAWAVLLALSGPPVLAAAWARQHWLVPARRFSLERGGQYMQAGAVLVLAVGAASVGWPRGALGALAYGAWTLACIVRAVRLGRDGRKITGMARARDVGNGHA